MRRLRLILLLFVAAGLLGGCVLRIVYEQLDWLTIWYIESYVSLDSRQKQQARTMVRRNLAWHRANELPEYAVLTRDLLAQTGQSFTTEDVAARYDAVVQLCDRFLVQVVPDAGTLFESLSDRQVEALFEKLARENAELAKEYSGKTPAVRRARQAKAIIRAFRQFTGPLTREQQALVRARTLEFDDSSPEWLARRAAWQAEFREVLAERDSAGTFLTEFSNLVLNPNQFDSPTYRRQVTENQQRAFSLVAEVLNSLNARQQAHLRSRLETYLADINALMQAG